MAAPLADLSLATVLTCRPERFRSTIARDLLRSLRFRHYAYSCALVFFSDAQSNASPDVAEVVYDPWMHAGMVVYGDNAMLASGPDIRTVVNRWLPRARAAGF